MSDALWDILNPRSSRQNLARFREGNRFWWYISQGKYSLCTVEESTPLSAIEERKAAIQAEWTDKDRRERLGSSGLGKFARTVYRPALIVGPRESGEAADRQYHGDMWIHGEW